MARFRIESTKGISERLPKGIFRAGLPWGGGKIPFYLRVKSLPGDNPNPRSGPILDPTESRLQVRFPQLLFHCQLAR